MERISRPALHMEIAEQVARRSTCFRANVGAIITLNHRTISYGYNGPPSGDEHCKGNKCELKEDGGCVRSVHAEINAIHFANTHLDDLHPDDHLDLYCTYSPCPYCAMEITDFSLKFSRYFFRHRYRDERGLIKVSEHMPCYRVTPSGYIIEEVTNRIVTEREIYET